MIIVKKGARMKSELVQKNLYSKNAGELNSYSVADFSLRNADLQRKSDMMNNYVSQLSKIDYTTGYIRFSNVNKKGRYDKERVGIKVHAELKNNEPLTGSKPNSSTHKDLMQSIYLYQNTRKYVRGHLMNDHLGGIGEWYNLFPISSKANHDHLMSAEACVKQGIKEGWNVVYDVNVEPHSSAKNIARNPSASFHCKVQWLGNSGVTKRKYTVSVFSGKEGEGYFYNEKGGAPDRSFGMKNDDCRLKASGMGESRGSKNSRINSTVDGLRPDNLGHFKFKSENFQSKAILDYWHKAFGTTHSLNLFRMGRRHRK